LGLDPGSLDAFKKYCTRSSSSRLVFTPAAFVTRRTTAMTMGVAFVTNSKEVVEKGDR
jgi:6-phosphogluconolactonase/glucosamine-6-phosphate isomerase/deaminase